jgi:hypothetical protein
VPVSGRFRQASRAGAALLAVVALVTAARELPGSLRTEDGLLAENAGRSRLQRELAPALAFDLDPSLVLLAAQKLPRDAVFYVATGPGLVSGRDAAGPFSAYWLLPRRHTDDIEQAQWILGFGVDPGRLGVPVEVVDELGNGDKLLRVRR